jgi:hypothetical protein
MHFPQEQDIFYRQLHSGQVKRVNPGKKDYPAVLTLDTGVWRPRNTQLSELTKTGSAVNQTLHKTAGSVVPNKAEL